MRDEHQLWADMTSGPLFCRCIGTFYTFLLTGKRVGKYDSDGMAGRRRPESCSRFAAWKMCTCHVMNELRSLTIDPPTPNQPAGITPKPTHTH